MPLWIICHRCGKARQALDPSRSTPEQLGIAVQEASSENYQLTLADENFDFGCECSEPARLPRRPIWNLRQAIVVVTALCVVLAVFRRPLRMLFGVNAWNAIAAPWQVYGWLFWGADLPNKADIGRNPIAIFWLCTSMVAAALAGWFVVSFAGLLFLRGWRWATQDHSSTNR